MENYIHSNLSALKNPPEGWEIDVAENERGPVTFTPTVDFDETEITIHGSMSVDGVGGSQYVFEYYPDDEYSVRFDDRINSLTVDDAETFAQRAIEKHTDRNKDDWEYEQYRRQ